jgi:hypothetical protein
LGNRHPPKLLPPPVIRDIGDPEGLDHVHHLFALAEQDVRFPQFPDDLFGTVPLLRHGFLLESV